MRVILGIIGIFFLGLVSYNFVLSSSGSTQEDSPHSQKTSFLGSIVLLDALRKHDPEAYQRVIRASNGSTQTEREGKVTRSIAFSVDQTLGWLSTAEADEAWAQAYLQQLREANRVGKCAHIMGKVSDNSLAQKQSALQSRTQQQSLAALSYVYETKKPESERLDFGEIELNDAMRSLYAEFVERYGQSALYFNSRELSSEKAKAECTILIGLYTRVLSFSEKDKGKALKWLFKNYPSFVTF